MSDVTRRWLVGLLKGTISGTATAASVIFSQIVVTEHVAWKVVGMSILIPTALRIFEYLKQHPLPGVDEENIQEE